MTPGAMGDDTMDDITSMKIGFNLFYEHGKFAETLTADNILCVLETTPGATFLTQEKIIGAGIQITQKKVTNHFEKNKNVNGYCIIYSGVSPCRSFYSDKASRCYYK